jgi:pimeloyl-ACP methyl ester carboxylesterase
MSVEYYVRLERGNATRVSDAVLEGISRLATARAFVERLEERTEDRDRPITVKAFRTQLKAIKRWGRSTPADLSAITQPTLIANGDNDRMVPSVLSEDMHRRIAGSKLIIYPDSGHGAIFQYHAEFASTAIEFIDDDRSRQSPGLPSSPNSANRFR